MDRVKADSKDIAFISLIVLTGLGLRLWGITWGFPRIDLNPDELNVFEISTKLTLRDLNPHFFSYSGLTFYLNYFSTRILSLLHFNMDPFHKILIHRLWSVFWGTLTIPLCYWAAKELFKDKKAAYLAAAFMAIMPLHIWDSHFGTTDIGLTFWTTFAFLMSIKAYKKPSIKNYFLGGLVVGLAMGVKFNGALAGISFLAAALLTFLEKRMSWPKGVYCLALAFLGVVIAFFIASPYTFLDYHGSIDAFLFEFKHSTEVGHFGFDLSARGWQFHPYVYQIFAAFPFSLGFLLWMATFAGLFFFMFKSPLSWKVMGLSFVTFYFLILSRWKFVPIRYYLPLLPPLTIITAYSLSQLLKKSPRWGAVILAAIFTYTLIFSLTTTDRFRHDTRLEAAAWAIRNLKAGSEIVIVDPHFKYSYAPFFDVKLFSLFRMELRVIDSKLKNRSLSPRCILCLSSLDYDRYYRNKTDQKGIRIWESIRKSPEIFHKIKEFDGWFLNKSIYSQLDPLFGGYFVSPTIEFYQYLPQGNPGRVSIPSPHD
jgi:4-amino-4-deoxy-L-arabinose transferase-like glycosyltransferase